MPINIDHACTQAHTDVLRQGKGNTADVLIYSGTIMLMYSSTGNTADELMYSPIEAQETQPMYSCTG